MASSAEKIDKINHSLYSTRRIALEYADVYFKRQLMPPESVILQDLHDSIQRQPILDIGVGGGRTTPHLLAISDKYIGIDYSASMIEYCRSRFPGIDFRQCDARDLSPFETAQFAMVFFSFNSIDHVSTDDRCTMLREIRRVLRPDGVFVFSSHNLLCKRRTPRDFPLMKRGAAVSDNLATMWNFVRNWTNYLRRKRLEVYGDGHALVVDQAHFFRLLVYYITPQRQLRQLEQAGFGEVRMFGVDGRTVTVDEHAQDAWIYYVARRPAA